MSTAPDITNLSLHHAWESRQFNKKEYFEIINKLANKGNDSIMVDNHSLRVVGTVMRIWQTFKGFFGFENQTDPIKVNYELLKLMRYGEKHGYLDDATIKASVQKLRLNLSKEAPYKEVANIIKERFTVSVGSAPGKKFDEAISTYVSKATNRSHLEEAFWPKLIHRLFAPVRIDNSTLQYNQGRIHAANGDFQKAIDCLHTAVEHSGNKQDWLLQLATVQEEFANQLIQSQPLHAEKAYRDANETLKRIELEKAEEDFKAEVLPLREKVLTGLIVLQARNKKYTEIVQDLKQECTLTHLSIDQILKNVQPTLIQSLTTQEKGNFYLALAQEVTFREAAGNLYKTAIDNFSQATQENQNPTVHGELTKDLVKAQLGLLENRLHAGDLLDINKLLKEIVEKMQTNELTNNPEFSQQLITNMQLLVDKQIEMQNYDGVIEAVNSLKRFGVAQFTGKEYLSDHPVLEAKLEFAYAKINQNKGNLEDAIEHLNKAQQLHPESSYNTLLKDLNGAGREQYEEAKKLLDNNDFDGAITVFQKLVEQYKTNLIYKEAVIQTYQKAGSHFLNNRNIEKAIKYYQSALEYSGNRFGFYVTNLIEAHSMLKNPERNVANYEHLTKMFPDIVLKKIDANDYIAVAKNRINESDFKEATRLLASAYSQFPENQMVAKEYAHAVYLEQMETKPPATLEERFEFYNRVIGLSKDVPDTCYLELAYVYATAFEEKRNPVTGRLLPTSPSSQIEKIKDGLKAKAVENIKKLADANPENAMYQYLCGKYMWHFLSGNEGLPYLKKAYEKGPDNVDFAFGYSEGLYRNLDEVGSKADPVSQGLMNQINAWKQGSEETNPSFYLRNRWNRYRWDRV